MKFAISEVFCEVVSALGFVFALLPIAFYLDIVTPSEVVSFITTMTSAKLLSVVVASYVLGVFLNIIGLPADRVMKAIGITGQYPPDQSAKRFFQKATSDLFDFRTNVWNHYYCFRNLLTFSPFALCLWAPIVAKHQGNWTLFAFIAIFVVTVFILYRAVKEHADFYTSVTKSFDS